MRFEPKIDKSQAKIITLLGTLASIWIIHFGYTAVTERSITIKGWLFTGDSAVQQGYVFLLCGAALLSGFVYLTWRSRWWG